MINPDTPPQFQHWLTKAAQPFAERLPLVRMEKRCHLICAMHIDQPKSYPLSIACQLAHAQAHAALVDYLEILSATADPLVQTFVKPWIKNETIAHTLLGKRKFIGDNRLYDKVRSLLISDRAGAEPPDVLLNEMPPLTQLMFWALSGNAQGLLRHLPILNAIEAVKAAPLLVLLFGKYIRTRIALHLAHEPAYYCIDAIAVEKHIRALGSGEQRILLGKPRTQTQIQACLKEYTGDYTELLNDCYCT